MKKNDKIQDRPEFKYLEANFDKFVKEMEDDKESANLKIPDDWEQDFTRTLDETLDGNARKRRRKIVKRIAGVAAAAVLVLVIGNFTAVSVSGEGLLEMFWNRFAFGNKQNQTYGTNNEIEFEEDNNQYIKYFDGTTLEKVCDQIRKELKCPMFYSGYTPEGFTVEEATYEKAYRIINIKLINENSEYIYIFQQMQVDDIGSGIVEDDVEESILVSNENLNNQIPIYEGVHDNSWLLEINMNNDLLTINTSISKDECIKIAENIDYY